MKVENGAAQGGSTAPVAHGARSFMRTGQLPKRLAWMQQDVDTFRDGLLEDLGGELRVTASQRALVDQAVRLQTVILLLMANILRRGAVARDGEPRAPVKSVAAFENSLRLVLGTLGLGGERRAGSAGKPAPSGPDLRELWGGTGQAGAGASNGAGKAGPPQDGRDRSTAPPGQAKARRPVRKHGGASR